MADSTTQPTTVGKRLFDNISLPFTLPTRLLPLVSVFGQNQQLQRSDPVTVPIQQQPLLTHNSKHNQHETQQKQSVNVNSNFNPIHRKKPLNRMNRKKIDQDEEEDNQGNHECALYFYFTAIENMLKAMPDALKTKLRDFISRTGLTEEMINHIIQAAITGAVALKQSPIPDAISATVNYTMKKIKNIDEVYGLQDKAWEISRSGINLAFEIDQQYSVHEKVSNILFTSMAAAIKAGVAYKNSPSYKELKH
ncbi:7796_t:CDS:2 [Entrophospora sp. SA101]|nr:7796_t:CDS:2 [Entrophospora sp. SA101]